MTNLLCGFLVLATVVIALCATVGWECGEDPAWSGAMAQCHPISLESAPPERVFLRPLSPIIGLVSIGALLHVRRRFLARPQS